MSVTIRDDNNIPRLLQALAELEDLSVEIGIFGEEDSEILMIAAVHEFGCQVAVTPKMRGWFRGQGHPLKKGTTQINIPERSYVRAGFDESEEKITQSAELLLDGVLQLEITPAAFYEALGAQVVSMLQGYLTNLTDPPLSDMTKDRKGSSNPLIDTGRLRQSITWRVVSGQ